MGLELIGRQIREVAQGGQVQTKATEGLEKAGLVAMKPESES